MLTLVWDEQNLWLDLLNYLADRFNMPKENGSVDSFPLSWNLAISNDVFIAYMGSAIGVYRSGDDKDLWARCLYHPAVLLTCAAIPRLTMRPSQRLPQQAGGRLQEGWREREADLGGGP